mgnify:FL=1
MKPKKLASRKVSPARLVATRFGGIRKLARELKIDPSAISKWIRENGGAIPTTSRGRRENWHHILIALFKREGLPLTTEELTFGGTP